MSAVALALAVLLAIPSGLAAQGGAPLQKSEIVRLLAGGTYSNAEVAEIIRQNCLSFTPTTRDRSDFRALGADDTVLRALDDCVAGRAVEEAAPPTDVAIVLRRRNWEGRAGEELSLTAYVEQAGAPVAGEALVLEGATAIEGGPAQDPRAETDAEGRAVFRLFPGTLARSWDLAVRSLDRPGLAPARLSVQVGPGAPATVDAPDPPIEAGAGPVVVRIVVRDAWGNPVAAGTPLALRAGDADGPLLFEGATSDLGVVTVRFPSASLAGVRRVTALSGERRLAALDVVLPTRIAAIESVSGRGQTARPGAELPAPVVLAVVDSAGRPVAGAAVQLFADGGTVVPGRAVTDAEGRLAVRVTADTAATGTVLRAVAGTASLSLRFPVSRPGPSAAEIEARLDEADRLLAAGEAEAAWDLYEEVAAVDPANRRAALGSARAALALGALGEAADRAEGRLRAEPEDVDAWVVLGEARAALGEEEAARFAWEQALLLDPDSAAARDGLEALAGERPEPVAAGEFLVGNTNADSRSFGPRYAELRIAAVDWLRLRGTFDDMLGLRHPWQVRGFNSLRSWYGAATLRWGSGGGLETTFEAGRRDYPGRDGLYQTSWLVEQGIRLSPSASVRVGGWLGRWYDRDDKAVYGEARLDVARGLSLRPSVSWADNAGSNISGDEGGPGTGRAAETEIRLGVGLRYEAPSGWSVEPAVAYGSVSADDPAFEGGLLDATARVLVPIGRVFSLQGFVRYQSPPGTPSFVSYAAGLGVAVP